MTRLGAVGIPTHFIRRLNMREQLIKKVEIIPLEVVVRNIAAGTLSTRLGIEEGQVLPRPMVEFYFKDDALGDPLVTEEHIAAFGWAGPQEYDDLISLALRVNDFMSGLFAAVGIRLVDFKLEFGRYFEGDSEIPRILLADEISPDSCRLWDFETGEKLDKDRFRRDLGGVTEAYAEVARRLGIIKESGETDRMGYKEVEAARIGKVIELDIDDNLTSEAAETRVKEMCEKLLANTVIESYRIEFAA